MYIDKNMLPEIWGESGWDFLHYVTMGYPEDPTENDKEKYRQYFHSLKYVLPCPKCRNNMQDHLEKSPLTDEVLAGRASLIKWGIDLHNIVNYYTGKPMLTYAEAMTKLNDKVNRNSAGQNNIVYYIILIIAILVILYLLYLCYKKKK